MYIIHIIVVREKNLTVHCLVYNCKLSLNLLQSGDTVNFMLQSHHYFTANMEKTTTILHIFHYPQWNISYISLSSMECFTILHFTGIYHRICTISLVLPHIRTHINIPFTHQKAPPCTPCRSWRRKVPGNQGHTLFP